MVDCTTVHHALLLQLQVDYIFKTNIVILRKPHINVLCENLQCSVTRIHLKIGIPNLVDTFPHSTNLVTTVSEYFAM